MKYLTLIYRAAGVATSSAVFEAYGALTTELGEAGILAGGNPLQPPSEAACIQIEKGKVKKTPGAFAPSTHSLVGYFLLDCATSEEAHAIAARIPDARHGVIEVRPVLEH